jgi:hypothetical protein
LAPNGIAIVQSGRNPSLKVSTPKGQIEIVLLSDADSLSLWKGEWLGRDRIFLTKGCLVLDGDNLQLVSTNPGDLSVAMYPPPTQAIRCQGKPLLPASAGVEDQGILLPAGMFCTFTPHKPEPESLQATAKIIRNNGVLRKIPLGKISQPVAAAPVDDDFDQAAVWHIDLPLPESLHSKNSCITDPVLLRINYIGDVARLILNGKLLVDDFYNGKSFEVGLNRYAPAIFTGDLRLEILPLQKYAPIYLAKKAQPDFGTNNSLAMLRDLEIIPNYMVTLSSAPNGVTKKEASQAAN